MRVLPLEEKRVEGLKRAGEVLQRKLGVKVIIRRDALEISGEAFAEYQAEEVLKAVGVGFSLENALRLLEEGYCLEEVEIPGSLHRRRTIAGRVIGRQGKVKSFIEEATGTTLVVGSQRVFILGDIQNVEIAKRAVEKLLRGAPHTAVFSFLNNWKKRKGKNLWA